MNSKKTVSPIAVAVIIAIFCLAIVIFLKPQQSTGSAVYVKYYGISDQPLAGESGKIQTYVRVSQPTLLELGRVKPTAVKTATDIIETADFANSIAKLYERNAPAIIPGDHALSAVLSGAEGINTEFKENTKCLQQIGNIYGKDEGITFVIVTELFYYTCNDHYAYNQFNDWMAAKAMHTFYTADGEVICTQETYPLFTVSEGTGETSTNIAGC